MKVRTGLLRFFRKLKSILVLCVTISLLFYYTFQNEIDILNSYAENEYLPSINVNTLQAATDYIVDTEKVLVDGLSGNDILKSNLNDRQPKVNLNEKNKYFPLLVPSPEMDPSLDYQQQLSGDSTSSSPLIYKEKYPVLYEMSLPIDSSDKLGPQFPVNSESDEEMLGQIRDIFMKSWGQQAPQWMNDPWPIHLVDSLDSLYIMGETSSFDNVVGLLSTIDFKVPYTMNQLIDIPNLVSRGLGGLLSAYELSRKDVLLIKAKQLGDFVLRAFDTPNRLPVVSYPWRSPYNNRFPYKETNLGTMMKMTLELTRLTQLSGDNKYFDAIYHSLQYLWETAGELPIKSLFPNIVDASGCKPLSKQDLSVGTHQKDQMMKSINEDLSFVYCHQLKHFANFSSIISLGDKDYFSVYDSLTKLYALTNVDILHSMQPSLEAVPELDATKDSDISSNGQSALIGVEDSDITRRDLSSIHKQKIIDSKVIFQEAMEHIIKLMSFKPSTPMDLTLLSSLYTNALYSPTTNELSVQLRRDFKFEPESCQFVATLIYGNQLFTVDKLKDQSHLQVATELIHSCFALIKQFEGVQHRISLDWGSDYPPKDFIKEDPIKIDDDDTDEISVPNNLPYNENTKLQDILVGKYIGFEKGFPVHNEVFASKVKQSNLNDKEWTTSYTYLHNERFLNVKLNNMDVDMDQKKWNTDHHHNADNPLWINGIDDSKESILSPHLIKSVFYMYRTTADPQWRQMGKELFAITINKIKEKNQGPKGMWKVSEIHQENIPSFWFSQTLKYYYLLFDSPSKYSLNDYVFTSNAHLLTRSKKVTGSNKAPVKKGHVS